MHQFIKCILQVTSERRADFSRAWGHGFEQEGGGGGWAGQLNLCVETINRLRGYS